MFGEGGCVVEGLEGVIVVVVVVVVEAVADNMAVGKTAGDFGGRVVDTAGVVRGWPLWLVVWCLWS